MSIFSKVKRPSIKFAKFDLSYEKKFDMDMGQLIPIMADVVLPNEHWKISEECVCRFAPLVAPVLQEVNAYVHYFYVPLRLLMDEGTSFEDFITGGEKGLDNTVLPRWNPTTDTAVGANGLPKGSSIYSLWDYLGFPVGLKNFKTDSAGVAYGAPLAFPKRAYNLIYNEWYRDKNYQEEIDLDSETIQFRNVAKDYFSSALPWIVKGEMPYIDLGTASACYKEPSSFFPYSSALLPVVATDDTDIHSGSSFSFTDSAILDKYLHSGSEHNSFYYYRLRSSMAGTTDGNSSTLGKVAVFGKDGYVPDNGHVGSYYLPPISVNLNGTIKIDDLRNLMAQERWMMANVNAPDYQDFLKVHFGVAPRDEVLQKPEYIGGVKMPVIISEVAQTSSTDSTSPQGNLTGQGTVANGQYVSSYFSKEYGVIIGIMSILPKQTYMNGIDRQWLASDKFDFPFPEFVNLDAQPVWKQEVFATTDGGTENTDIFGYQGRFDEYRVKLSKVCGNFRDKLDYWHLGRNLTSSPNLGSDFISAKYYSTQAGKRIFAVQEDDLTKRDAERCIYVNFRNVISAVRPIPFMSN